MEQVAAALWLPEGKTREEKQQAVKAAYGALQAIAPQSELEGMLAAQMISTHNAAMECLRRAMIPDQSLKGHDQNLKHATKLLAIYERQLAALDKHRGRGQQKITVEHVNVHAGGQAIVGHVDGSPKPPTPAASQEASSARPALADGRDERVTLPNPLSESSPETQKVRKSTK